MAWYCLDICSKGSELDCGNRLAIHLKASNRRTGRIAGRADATTLKTALQTPNTIKSHGVPFVDPLKATIQSAEKCYGRFSTLSTRKFNRSAQKLYTDVTINPELGRNLNSFSRQAESRRQSNPSSLSLSSTQYPTL
jgi:hypothetical protein